jgi:membrane protein implicated in regulation of membrane protease activity
MTVFVLAVLWLIVLVPMFLRRNDERRRDRGVDGFGRAMRALGRRSATGQAEVFVAPNQEPPRVSVAPAARRPEPAPEEALLHPVDRAEMSQARQQMMARRRRSLTVLGVGSAVFTLIALVAGSLFWLPAIGFLLGLTGYLWFLRSQALRDRERRQGRQLREAQRRPVGFDATTELTRFEQQPESVVRIDDDDLDLHNMDTIDLTGLYTEELAGEVAQRRAS